MTTTARWALVCFFALYFAVAFAWPSWRVWRQTGRNPYVLTSGDDAYGFVTRGFRFIMRALIVYIVAQAFWPDIDQWLGVLHWMERPVVYGLGWLGLCASLVWIVIAQYQMGQSWRIGIDYGRPADLIMRGLFSISRNPIFLAMRLSLFSVVLIRPNVVTIAVWLVGDVLIQFQTRLEETFLSTQYGAEYAAYRSKVNRWL